MREIDTVATIAPSAPHVAPASLAERLEAHRDHYFRRIMRRRVTGEQTALRFINETGFCAAFSAGLGLPCLREAIEGRREPELPHHIQHDPATMLTWRLKDTLPARRAVYYGKVFGGRPSFIARELLPAFLRLRIEPGGYRRLYERGLLSHCGRLVMDALTRHGACETKALKLMSGFAQPKKRAEFDHAMSELQQRFLALKVEERYEPFTYVWDTVEHHWADAIVEARRITRRAAACRILRRYYEIAGYGNERAVARLLGLSAELLAVSAHALEAQRVLRRAVRVPGHRTSLTLLATLA